MTVNFPELESNLIWSATPSPLTEDMEIDVGAVQRLVEHHIKLGITGLFLLGTCGEGPWMPDRLRWELEGGDLAVVAAPYFVIGSNPAKLEKLYREVVEHSPLPIGIYDRGEHGPITVPLEVLEKIVTDEKVVVVKDSSSDTTRQASYLAVRRTRDSLRLFTGDEFDCVSYLQAGYDGLLLGGGIFNGHIARQIMEAVAAGNIDQASQLEDRMKEMMWAVYGGKDITCWISGLKHLLVKMGIFSTTNNFLDYPLTDECIRDIDHALQEYRDILFPGEGN